MLDFVLWSIAIGFGILVVGLSILIVWGALQEVKKRK
jgi:hypothetical protein